MSYLVFDLETVPDMKVWTPEPKKPRAKKDPADAFAPLYAHRPIAIGYVALDDDLNATAIGCVGTSTFKDDERALLSAFSNWVTPMTTTMVTFAGHRFDMPVLALRALRHALPHGWYDSEKRNRYRETSHLDLFTALTEGSPENKFSLDTFCKIIGLPGKGGFDGSMVKGAFERGEIAKIEGYCTQDAVRTTFLLFRYLLMRGRITELQYHTAATGLWHKSVEMNLGGIIFGADMNVLFPVQPTETVAQG